MIQFRADNYGSWGDKNRKNGPKCTICLIETHNVYLFLMFQYLKLKF